MNRHPLIYVTVTGDSHAKRPPTRRRDHPQQRRTPARYRARHKTITRHRSSGCAIGGQPTGVPGHNAGTMPSPRLLALQAEFIAWLDALPDGLRDTATAEALRAIAELDLTELQAIIPPRGFGRDR